MFIEVTRNYINNPYEHKMLLNVATIMKVEPIAPSEDKAGNTRIVLDRKQEDGNYIVMYVADLYSSVSLRIKQIYNPPNKRKKK